MRFIAKHPNFQFIGIVVACGTQLAAFFSRHHIHPTAFVLIAGVVRAQGFVDIRHFGLARQVVQKQGQLHQHALSEIANRGQENGAACQAGVLHDLGHVLVLKAQSIGFVQGCTACFIVFNHAAPTAGVTTH